MISSQKRDSNWRNANLDHKNFKINFELPPLEPIAIARVLPDADHLTALAGQNENEVLVSICTVYFKIAVYRINLSFILNGARMMQDVEENSSSSDVSDP
ncbi:unnamed protein product [Gongylonema pulchrum]|uniref:PITH domain-containing protein n=1 Tax=Gongylonema pulchrum TaxID=637853 RepID=A0A183DDH6_9BILA|nr:unnamed protein product [Gongylonema pulchrum]